MYVFNLWYRVGFDISICIVCYVKIFVYMYFIIVFFFNYYNRGSINSSSNFFNYVIFFYF